MLPKAWIQYSLSALLLACSILSLSACSNRLYVAFGSGSATEATEGTETFEIQFELSGPLKHKTVEPGSENSDSDLNTVIPFTLSGTAIRNSDYTVETTTAIIPYGQRRISVKFTVIDDVIDEPDETIIITAGTPSSGIWSGPTSFTVTLKDNDPPPPVTFTTDNQVVDEGVGTVSIDATLNIDSGYVISVPYFIGGTALNPNDHNLADGIISFPVGTKAVSVPFQVVDDEIDELDETITVTMGTPDWALTGAFTSQTITILDNDPTPTVFFSTAALSTNEVDAETLTLQAILSKVSGLQVTVPYTVAGTAKNPQDHNLSAGSLTIPAGSPSASTNFQIVNDALDEDDETIIINMGVPTNAIAAAPSTETVTVLDDDPLPNVTFSAALQSQLESVTAATLQVNLNPVSGRTVTVPYSVVGGTAKNPQDHNLASGNITITEGNVTGTKAFTLVNDTLDEDDETILIDMGNPTNATKGAITSQTFTIQDEDPEPNVSFTAASQNYNESTAAPSFTAQLNTASGKNVTVPFTVADDTAKRPADYTLADGSISITAGQTKGSQSFTINNDTLYEGNEHFDITMGNPTNATKGAFTTFQANILDDDPAPTADFTAASQSPGEGDGSVDLTAKINKVSGLDVTIPFTVNGASTAKNPEDHDLSNGSISILAGSTESSKTINIVDDALDEDNETIIVDMAKVLTNATPGTVTQQTITILDNDPLPSVTFHDAAENKGEGDGSTTVTVDLSAKSGRDVTIPFTVGGTATPGVDHDLADGNISISAGTLSNTKSMNITDDTLDEDDETVIITMGDPMNADKGATTEETITIADNDATPTVNFSKASQTVGESGAVTVTAELNAKSGRNVTVPYTVGGTATPGVDHDLDKGDISIPAGSLSTDKNFNVTPDTLDEDDETVELTMGVPINATKGATSIHTVTITDDDDPPTVDLSADDSTDEDKGPATFSAILSTKSGKDITVPFAVNVDLSTGTRDLDFVLNDGDFKIAAGSLSASQNIDIFNDMDPESNETVVIEMGDPTNATKGVNTTHTTTIMDNDRLLTNEKLLLSIASAQGITHDEDQKVRFWRDRSLQSNLLFQLDSAIQPILRRPDSVRFDSADTEMRVDENLLPPRENAISYVVEQQALKDQPRPGPYRIRLQIPGEDISLIQQLQQSLSEETPPGSRKSFEDPLNGRLRLLFNSCNENAVARAQKVFDIPSLLTDGLLKLRPRAVSSGPGYLAELWIYRSDLTAKELIETSQYLLAGYRPAESSCELTNFDIQ